MLTPEGKQLIAKYMGWMCPIIDQTMPCIRLLKKNYKIVNFDLNDASLVVAEMQKREEWEHDFMDFVAGSQKWNYHQLIAWLFNADNFFKSFTEWRKTK